MDHQSDQVGMDLAVGRNADLLRLAVMSSMAWMPVPMSTTRVASGA